MLRDFTSLHVPSTDADNGMVFFPTPASISWGDVVIRFVDGHSVSVAAGEVTRTLHYAQLGMADGRNARPTRQWGLLRSLHKGTKR